MATEVQNAPFIDVDFYVTGAWGEPRATHIHAGVDLSTGQHKEVYNMYEGRVIEVGDGRGYGPYIIIKSDDGNAMLYGDMSETQGLQVGDIIAKNQRIGSEGNPGGTTSTGFHVHIEKEYLGESDIFRFGYDNSIDPVAGTGIPNFVSYSSAYIYDGEIPPVPPTPTDEVKVKRFNWPVFTRTIRNRRNRI